LTVLRFVEVLGLRLLFSGGVANREPELTLTPSSVLVLVLALALMAPEPWLFAFSPAHLGSATLTPIDVPSMRAVGEKHRLRIA
jgi:hypothetical protein